MKAFTYLFLLGITISISAQQKGKQTLAQLEESPAGSKIIWFLDAVESGTLSDESIKKYFSPKLLEKIGPDKIKASFDDIQENDGTLILFIADRLNLAEYKLALKGSKSNEWLEMKFYFEDNMPYRIVGFTIDTTEGGNDLLKPIYPKSN